MSRRNGQSLARYVLAKIGQLKQDSPNQPPDEYWKQVLQRRSGWRQINADAFEFRTGDRLELRKGAPIKELLARMTEIEVKPLGAGLPAEAQKVLLEEARKAAVDWWEKNEAKG